MALRGGNRSLGLYFYETLLLDLMFKALRIFSFLALMFITSLSAQAQCAMCKAVASSSTEAGSTVATGLNGGIIYLMAFPYLIMAVVGYAIYRHRKQQTETKAD